MSLKDGLKLKPNRWGKIEIPNCRRSELPAFFIELGYKKGVEIGTYKGNFAKRFAVAGLEIHTVDPWMAYPEYGHPRVHFQKRQDAIYEHAKEKLASYPNAHIIRKTSMEAVKDFEDESIDYVYIDVHHGFKCVTEDIYEWSKKVRKGGIISGHDYALRRSESLPGKPLSMQVKLVIDSYTRAFDIRRWYVLGRGEKRKGEIREDYRSWFWFRK